jgi:hypothetical protein
VTIQNARFWVYLNGNPVKLTLRPGQTLLWSRCWRTDEGWDAEARHWSHDGDKIRLDWCTDGVDCDGRLREGGELSAALAHLHDGREVDGITYPEWQQRDTWRRDYQAEAAGY